MPTILAGYGPKRTNRAVAANPAQFLDGVEEGTFGRPRVIGQELEHRQHLVAEHDRKSKGCLDPGRARRLQPRQAGLVIDARGDPHRAFGLPHEPGKPLPAHEHGAQAEHAQLRVFRPAEERFAGTIERRVLFVGIPDLAEMPLARAANLLEAGLRQRGRAGRGACRPGHSDQEAERVFGGTHLMRHVDFVRSGEFGE